MSDPSRSLPLWAFIPPSGSTLCSHLYFWYSLGSELRRMVAKLCWQFSCLFCQQGQQTQLVLLTSRIATTGVSEVTHHFRATSGFGKRESPSQALEKN